MSTRIIKVNGVEHCLPAPLVSWDYLAAISGLHDVDQITYRERPADPKYWCIYPHEKVATLVIFDGAEFTVCGREPSAREVIGLKRIGGYDGPYQYVAFAPGLSPIVFTTDPTKAMRDIPPNWRLIDAYSMYDVGMMEVIEVRV